MGRCAAARSRSSRSSQQSCERAQKRFAGRFSYFSWSSWSDPLFTEALQVVEEQLAAHSTYAWNPRNTFHLQMAYLLLWTAIERYAALRYRLDDEATKKVNRVAEEPAFAEKLKAIGPLQRSIQRADKPTEKVKLKSDDPKKSMSYYYQVRSNMVHRGKGMPGDHETVRSSCSELLQIFRHVLGQAKQEAEQARAMLE